MSAWLGYSAAFFTTLCFLFQIYKIWKTKQVRDISVMMYIINFGGTILWILYGFSVNSWPLIIANSFILIFVTLVLIAKRIYRFPEKDFC